MHARSVYMPKPVDIITIKRKTKNNQENESACQFHIRKRTFFFAEFQQRIVNKINKYALILVKLKETFLMQILPVHFF